MIPGEAGLEAAIYGFVREIENGTIDKEATALGLFSYLLTKKQRYGIHQICQDQGWNIPQVKGITITESYIKHVLEQRKVKDAVDANGCAAIISHAFSTKSKVTVNRGRNQQAILFGAEKPMNAPEMKNLYGVAILQMAEKEITPVTAYHARGAKVKAFK